MLATLAHQHTFPCKISNFKNFYFINNKLIFLKLRIFTNFNTVFPVVVLVFDFEEFSEEVLHGHWQIKWAQNNYCSQGDIHP
jgi:hypothetical protein